MKVAILYICTGKYVLLWKDFYLSFHKNFLPNLDKTYFVFTDADEVDFEKGDPAIRRIYQQKQEWPYGTLLRFHMFNAYREELEKYDYIFFFNANSRAECIITEDMILPNLSRGEDLVVVKHPAYRNCSPFEFPYDRNFKSRACIPYGRGHLYVQGSLIGGTAEGFLKLSSKIALETDRDLKRGVIALWHDESHLNKYILHYYHYRLLPITFALPLLSKEPPCIYLRPKEDYFDIVALKKDAPASDCSRLNRWFNHYAFTFADRRKKYLDDAKYIRKSSGFGVTLLWKLKNFWKIIFHT